MRRLAMIALILLALSSPLPEKAEADVVRTPLLAAGDRHAVVVTHDGTVWVWGENAGALVDDHMEFQNRFMPKAVFTDAVATAAGRDYTLVLRSDGTVWGWGRDSAGQLGRALPEDVLEPTRVAGLADVIAVAAGGTHALALRRDHTVVAWGSNAQGQLGDGTLAESSKPVSVTGLTDVIAVAAGLSFSMALKSDGTVWVWGHGVTRPVQVPGIHNATAIAAGRAHALALESDGTVWAWGGNLKGQLGNGTTEFHEQEPERVPGLEGVTAIAAASFHSLALKADGSVWQWGYFTQPSGTDMHCPGKAGGHDLSTERPAQVPGLTGVTTISTGNLTALATRSDGTVWVWGWYLLPYNQVGPAPVPGFPDPTPEQLSVPEHLCTCAVITDSKGLPVRRPSFAERATDAVFETENHLVPTNVPGLYVNNMTLLPQGTVTGWVPDDKRGPSSPSSPLLFVNGRQTGLEAVVVDGHSMVPMRPLFESLGASVIWDAESRTVHAGWNGHSLSLTLDAEEAVLDGAMKRLDLPARLIDGKTYLPLRFVAETMGAFVGWYPVNRLITIQTPARVESGVVTQVPDTRTAEVRWADGRLEQIALVGLELQWEAQANTAKQLQFMRDHLVGERVSLEADLDEPAPSGHRYAYLYLPDGTMFNAWMLDAGMAPFGPSEKPLRYADLLEVLSRHASAMKAGLWSESGY